MTRTNIFFGDRSYAHFIRAAYKRFTGRGWVTYADVMADYLGKELEYSVSKCENYGELKKAFADLRHLITERQGKGCFEEEGNNRNKRFRYIGKDDDPLSDIRDAKVINNLKQYWQFCQDSAGFFPTSWLEYFFKDCRDLLDIKSRRQKGEQVLSASLDRMLTNIELLPMLYENIKQHRVLSIEYKPYDEEPFTLLFHPHYLKEFNGRWYLFGHAEDHTPDVGYNIAIDRIISKPREQYDIEYTPAPTGFYDNFFRDIVGVSHQEETTVETIHIRAHTHYIYKLTETKIMHQSQKTVIPYGMHEDGEYGEFTVDVELNNEFIGRILQMGDGLEIVSPEWVRETFKERVKRLSERYGLVPNK